jgi:hypothetical protein
VDHGDKEGDQDQDARNATDGEEKAETFKSRGNGNLRKRRKATVLAIFGREVLDVCVKFQDARGSRARAA